MKNKIPIVFFGTSGVCIPFLELLHQFFQISLIVTQPDKLGGRNRKQVIVPPVKTFAVDNHIQFLQPEKLDDTIRESLRSIEPKIGIVISYGQLIPKSIYTIPQFHMVNVHFSMLPSYRGAAPVQRALEKGDTQTGISIFELAKKMDAGDIWAQKEMEILPQDTTEALWDRMSREGAPFLIETLHAIFENRIQKTPQNHELATFSPAVTKEEGKIDWKLTAQQIVNRFRAFTPWPGLSCCACDKSFILTKIDVSEATHDGIPGEVLSWDKQFLRIACGDRTVLEIMELQPPGKKPMSPYCYCMGNQLPKCFS